MYEVLARDPYVDRFACKNWEPKCEYWASLGECQNSPGYMFAKCNQACDICRPLAIAAPRTRHLASCLGAR